MILSQETREETEIQMRRLTCVNVCLEDRKLLCKLIIKEYYSELALHLLEAGEQTREISSLFKSSAGQAPTTLYPTFPKVHFSLHLTDWYI